jgi:FixJ family two-component response regulator
MEASRVSPFKQPSLAPSRTKSDRWVGIIDDDASIRVSLARLFRGYGIRAEVFGSAEEYLYRSDPGEPDCLVLDVHLGGLTGFELQELLAARGEPPPIIFITAHDEIPSSRLARFAGSCGYLRKPFDTDALMALVMQHLQYEAPALPAL